MGCWRRIRSQSRINGQIRDSELVLKYGKSIRDRRLNSLEWYCIKESLKTTKTR